MNAVSVRERCIGKSYTLSSFGSSAIKAPRRSRDVVGACCESCVTQNGAARRQRRGPPAGSFVSEPADAIRLRSNPAAPTASGCNGGRAELGAGHRLVFGVRRPWGRRVSTVRPRRLGAAEYRETSPMPTARRLSILALTLLFVTVAFAPETREITREVTPSALLRLPPEETSSGQNVRLSSPWSNVDRSHIRAGQSRT